LKEHERHYATHDLELEAIVHALKMWKHYLMGKRFALRTYHNGLKYLFGQPTLNAKQSRWLDFLSEYDFDIKHMLVYSTSFLSELIDPRFMYFGFPTKPLKLSTLLVNQKETQHT
jgi:hypothetical protein